MTAVAALCGEYPVLASIYQDPRLLSLNDTAMRELARGVVSALTRIEQKEFACVFDRPASAELTEEGLSRLVDLAARAARKHAKKLEREGWRPAEDINPGPALAERLRIIKREKQGIRKKYCVTADAVYVRFERTS